MVGASEEYYLVPKPRGGRKTLLPTVSPCTDGCYSFKVKLSLIVNAARCSYYRKKFTSSPNSSMLDTVILIVYPQRCLILCIMSLLLVKGTRTMHLFFQDSTVNHGATCNQIRFHFNLFGICRFLTVALYISWCQARQLLGTQKGSPQWLHTACPKVHANQMVYELVNGLCCVADLANCH